MLDGLQQPAATTVVAGEVVIQSPLHAIHPPPYDCVRFFPIAPMPVERPASGGGGDGDAAVTAPASFASSELAANAVSSPEPRTCDLGEAV